jgi:prepilin-type N-terminal cleavage/methylation domain-containing protein
VGSCLNDLALVQSSMKSRKAFTLTELLVVISIIALLMAIMLPALSKAREIAGRTVCATNLKNIWTATNMYAADWDDNVSIRHWKYDSPQRSDNGKNGKWYVRYYEYLGGENIFRCPSFDLLKENLTKPIVAFGGDSKDFKEKTAVTYTMNEYISSSASVADIQREERYKLSRIQKYAANDSWMGIFLGDGIYETDSWGDRRSQRYFQERGLSEGRASYRHGGKCMFLTTDGRVGFYDEDSSLLLPRQGLREITPSMLN